MSIIYSRWCIRFTVLFLQIHCRKNNIFHVFAAFDADCLTLPLPENKEREAPPSQQEVLFAYW